MTLIQDNGVWIKCNTHGITKFDVRIRRDVDSKEKREEINILLQNVYNGRSCGDLFVSKYINFIIYDEETASISETHDMCIKSISAPPGFIALKIAEFVCPKKLYERVFLQAVVDMREEYFEALAAKRKGKARWVLVRAYLALAWTVTLQLAVSVPAKIVKTLWV